MPPKNMSNKLPRKAPAYPEEGYGAKKTHCIFRFFFQIVSMYQSTTSLN